MRTILKFHISHAIHKMRFRPSNFNFYNKLYIGKQHDNIIIIFTYYVLLSEIFVTPRRILYYINGPYNVFQYMNSSILLCAWYSLTTSTF